MKMSYHHQQHHHLHLLLHHHHQHHCRGAAAAVAVVVISTWSVHSEEREVSSSISVAALSFSSAHKLGWHYIRPLAEAQNPSVISRHSYNIKRQSSPSAKCGIVESIQEISLSTKWRMVDTHLGRRHFISQLIATIVRICFGV